MLGNAGKCWEMLGNAGKLDTSDEQDMVRNYLDTLKALASDKPA